MNVPPKPSADRSLHAENAELRARLNEAEETLRAIRSGEVDAIVVGGFKGPQIFVLQGLEAEQSRIRGEMLAQVSDAVVGTDTEDRITFLNAAAERRYGVRADDVLGCELTGIYTRLWPSPEAESAMRTAASERGGWCGELIHRTLDGRELDVETSITTLHGSEGERTGMIAAIRDVTARKRLEDEKAEAMRLLETLLAHAPVGFVFLDRDLRFRRINERLAEDNGYSVEAHLGRTVGEILPTLERALREVVARVLATGQPVLDQEFTGETASAPGVIRTWNESWYPVHDERGEIVGFGAVVEDITERRQAEEQLRGLAAKLSEADRRKDEFLATLAHELRNPLAPIRASLHLLKLSGGNPDVVRESTRIMERQLIQMSHLIDDLMDLSRISGGKIVLKKARLSLATVVQDAVDISRPLIEERGHNLIVDITPETINVNADRTRLAQVFGNLLNNAAKYTQSGGRIRVAVEHHGGEVVVAVEDNGVGISAPMLTRVFDMFAQVDRSLEKSQGGLGIGLNIVKRLVEMHDGSILAESGGYGAGSRFVVRLPIALSFDANQPDGEAEGVTAFERRRILVVDDNRDAADILASVLKLTGHELQTAYDGLEALEVAAAFRPDVVLLDIGMPKLNGYDTARRIRQQTWGKNMVLVALTGWGQDEDKRKSHEAGFDAHLVKPVDPATLDKFLGGLKTPSISP